MNYNFQIQPNMAMQERYDTAFLGILQHEGTIPPFLDAIFSFLYRRLTTICIKYKYKVFTSDQI